MQALKTERESIKRQLYRLAVLSPDPSTQNAAILMRKGEQFPFAGAYNGFPRGVAVTPERLVKPVKYQFMEHAERNAIYTATRAGQSTEGATMYCLWAACTDCARAIIQAGIKRVVTYDKYASNTYGRWYEDVRLAMDMLNESGVEVVVEPIKPSHQLEPTMGEHDKALLFNGKEIRW